MKDYLKLAHMEIYRFRFVLAGLMGLTLVMQLGALAVSAKEKVGMLEHMLAGTETYAFPWMSDGRISFAEARAGFFQWEDLSVLIVISVLLLYVFLIWYRDWLGRGAFIYRLLMLPASRIHLYTAKLTALMTFILCMLSWQALLLAIGRLLFNRLTPIELRASSTLTEAAKNGFLAYLMPEGILHFLYVYGIGMLAVLAVFTAILLERSYRLIGILYAGLYLAVCALAFALPIVSLGLYKPYAYFYPAEILAVELAMCVLVAVVSVWLAFRLLNRKIAV